MLQIHDEFAALVQHYRCLRAAWILYREKVLDVAANCGSSDVQSAVQAFQNETEEGHCYHCYAIWLLLVVVNNISCDICRRDCAMGSVSVPLYT